MNIVNYAIVCGIGVGINMVVIYGLVNLFPLAIANICAIFCAFLFNYTMTVGSLGYLWGFTSKSEKKEQKRGPGRPPKSKEKKGLLARFGF